MVVTRRWMSAAWALVVLVSVGCVPGGGGGSGGGGDDDAALDVDGGGAGGEAGVGGEGGAGGQGGMAGVGGLGGEGGAGGEAGMGGEGGAAGMGGQGGEGGAAGMGGQGGMGGEGGAGGGAGLPCETEGATERRPCGLNERGRISRTCTDGAWGPWSACDDPDVCVDRAEEVLPCGFNDRGEQLRDCVEGQWSAFADCDDPDVCADGGEESEACGLNGRGERSRTCAAGAWGAYGPCADADVCVDGGVEREVCGLNLRGERSRACVEGQWAAFAACQDPDECVDGAREALACGLNGRGERARSCAAGRWSALGACEDPDVCRDGVQESRACGLNARGEQSRTCTRGAWSSFGVCADPDVCVDGTVDREACGVNGNGTRSRICAAGRYGAFGQCEDPDGCVNGAVQDRACGLNGRGVQSSTCVDGVFGPFGACDDPDDCVDGTQEAEDCPDVAVDRVRTCAQGQFGGFVPAQCPQPQCDNDLDDDGDGRIDAADPGCDGARDDDEFDIACDNGFDDDGDGRVDLDDPGCARAADPDETDPAVLPECANGLDDDEDGLIDRADPQCPAAGAPFEVDYCVFTDAVVRLPVEGGEVEFDTTGNLAAGRGSCGGGGPVTVGVLILEQRSFVDLEITARSYDTLIHLRRDCDDAGTEVECNDDGGEGVASRLTFERLDPGTYFLMLDGYSGRSGTGTLTVRVEEAIPAECENAVDDDGDGRVDLDDPGCGDPLDDDESDEPDCQNTFDDDGDGRADLDDPGCDDADDNDEGDEPACQNNFDDDGDGRVDLEDIGCFDADDLDESDDPAGPACANGVDDDRDGLTDLVDIGCARPSDDDETDPGVIPACANGIDDDGDGQIDWPLDVGCAGSGDDREAEQCVDAAAVRVGQNPVLGRTVEGGADRFEATCGGFQAPDAVFVYTLDQPAQLVASVDDPGTDFSAVVSIRRACDEPSSELVCAGTEGPTAVLPLAQPGDYYIIVDGAGPAEVAGSRDPVVLPEDPRGYVARVDDLVGSVWQDAGGDAFDGYGRMALTVDGQRSADLEVTPGEYVGQVGDFVFSYRSDMQNNVWRMVIDHPEGAREDRVFDFELTGNLGSDGSTVRQDLVGQVSGQPLPIMRTSDAGPTDPPVYHIVMPGQIERFGEVQYGLARDLVTIGFAGAQLPLTVYVALSYVEDPQLVIDAVLADAVEQGGVDGDVGAFVLTVTEE